MPLTRHLAVIPILALTLAACSGAEGAGPDPASYDDGAGIEARVLPQLAAAGDDPQEAEDAAWVVEATIEDAEEGRPVELQGMSEEGWQVLEEGETDSDGSVSFATTSSGELRVVSESGDDVVGQSLDTSSAPPVSFSDEFDGDLAKWNTRAQGYTGIRQCSRADASASRVEDGVLELSVLDDPQREDCRHKGKRYAYRLNGHLGTETSYTFTHGFAAARIKFQESQGQHGAFWLQSFGSVRPGPPKKTGAEIDVIEYFGDGNPQGGLTSFVYWRPNAKGEMAGGWLEDPDQFGSDWSSKYHVFSVEWTPSEYVFRIDGQVTQRITEGVSGAPQFLVLSLLSSDYELKHMDDSDLPETMSVDWVRTWETGAG